MRMYWLKIVLGACIVFALGMAIRAVFRAAKTRVRAVARSSDPISIPLAFVPFRLEGERLGTFDRAVLIRKSPKQVTSIRLAVKLTDSAATARLSGCDLLARLTPGRRSHGVEFDNAEFACVKGDSVAGHGAERFGEVGFEPGDLTLALYLPSDVARDLRQGGTDAERGQPPMPPEPPSPPDPGEVARARGDSIAAAAERLSDSITEAVARLTDSLVRAGGVRRDSIARAVHRRADSVRARALHVRDSIRAADRPR